MRNFIILCLGALMLAACTTPQEKAAAAQADMDRMMFVYGPACAKLGYPANSDQWRSCILQLSTKDDMQRYYGYPSYSLGYGHSHWRGAGYWGPYW